MKTMISLKRSESGEPTISAPSEASYPTLYIVHEEDLELPKSGTATIEFEVVEKSEREVGGNEEYRCELRVKSIGGIKTVSTTRDKRKEDEDAIDSLAAEAEDED